MRLLRFQRKLDDEKGAGLLELSLQVHEGVEPLGLCGVVLFGHRVISTFRLDSNCQKKAVPDITGQGKSLELGNDEALFSESTSTKLRSCDGRRR